MFRQLFFLTFSFTSHLTLSSRIMIDLVMHQSRHTHIINSYSYLFYKQLFPSRAVWFFWQTKLFPICVKCKTLNTIEESPSPSKSAKCNFCASIRILLMVTRRLCASLLVLGSWTKVCLTRLTSAWDSYDQPKWWFSEMGLVDFSSCRLAGEHNRH